jgi:hypothetical protein
MSMEQGRSKPAIVRRTSAEIRSVISEYESSGMSPKGFCKLHQLKKAYFSRWLARYGSRKSPKGFVPVAMVSDAPSAKGTGGLFAEYRGIKIYQKVDPSYLKSLVS